MKTQTNHLNIHLKLMNLFAAFTLSVLSVVAIVSIVKSYKMHTIQKHTPATTEFSSTVSNEFMAIVNLPPVIVVGKKTDSGLASSEEPVKEVLLSEVVVYGKLPQKSNNTASTGELNIKMPAVEQFLQPNEANLADGTDMNNLPQYQ